MAAKGLPDVMQKFAADNADYLEKLNQNKDAIKGEVKSLEEHYRAVEKNREVVRQFSDELGRLQRKLEDVQQISNAEIPTVLAGITHVPVFSLTAAAVAATVNMADLPRASSTRCGEPMKLSRQQ